MHGRERIQKQDRLLPKCTTGKTSESYYLGRVIKSDMADHVDRNVEVLTNLCGKYSE